MELLQPLKTKLRYSLLHPRFIAHRELVRVIKKESAHLFGRVIDIGCGSKPYRDFFSKAELYIGMDVPTTIHDSYKINVIGTALAMPFSSCCFDGVLCTEVLEHLPDPLFALCEMNRITKPGGGLLLTVPLSEQLHEEPYDFYRFTPYSLKFLLEKAGWKITRFYYRGGAWLEAGYRLSSLLYNTFGSRKDKNGQQKANILAPLVVIACMLIQLLFITLDFLIPSQISTIGFGLFAVKEKSVSIPVSR